MNADGQHGANPPDSARRRAIDVREDGLATSLLARGIVTHMRRDAKRLGERHRRE